MKTWTATTIMSNRCWVMTTNHNHKHRKEEVSHQEALRVKPSTIQNTAIIWDNRNQCLWMRAPKRSRSTWIKREAPNWPILTSLLIDSCLSNSNNLHRTWCKRQAANTMDFFMIKERRSIVIKVSINSMRCKDFSLITLGRCPCSSSNNNSLNSVLLMTNTETNKSCNSGLVDQVNNKVSNSKEAVIYPVEITPKCSWQARAAPHKCINQWHPTTANTNNLNNSIRNTHSNTAQDKDSITLKQTWWVDWICHQKSVRSMLIFVSVHYYNYTS